mgnify:CR=1 FL=1|jgi:hypothetical protein
MSKFKKFWIGFFTFLPILGFIGYFVFFFAMFFNFTQSVAIEGSEPENMSTFFSGFAFVFASLLVAVLSGIGIMIYDIVHVVNNKKFTENNRLMWILILVLASGIGSIIYFFVEIMPAKNEDAISIT